MLKAKLLALKKAEEKAQLDEMRGDVQASWGDQMRNYVLNPYQIVKDLRTGYEAGNPQRRCSTARSTTSSRPGSAGAGAPTRPRTTSQTLYGDRRQHDPRHTDACGVSTTLRWVT